MMFISDINQAGGIGSVREPSSQKPEQVSVKKPQSSGQQKAIDSTEINRILRDDTRILEGAKLLYEALPDVRADKVELAQKRLASGYYDRPEVRAEIAGKMVKDPESAPHALFSEERADQIREKSKLGFYDRPEIRNQIARGMIDDATESEA